MTVANVLGRAFPSMQNTKKVEPLGRKAKVDVHVDSAADDSPSDPIAAALAARKERLGDCRELSALVPKSHELTSS